MNENEPEAIGRRNSDIVMVELKAQMSQVVDKLNKIIGWFEGNGTAENPGVMIRLDRLEQAETERRQQRIIIYTAIIGLIVERGFHYISLLRGVTGGHG